MRSNLPKIPALAIFPGKGSLSSCLSEGKLRIRLRSQRPLNRLKAPVANVVSLAVKTQLLVQSAAPSPHSPCQPMHHLTNERSVKAKVASCFCFGKSLERSHVAFHSAFDLKFLAGTSSPVSERSVSRQLKLPSPYLKGTAPATEEGSGSSATSASSV